MSWTIRNAGTFHDASKLLLTYKLYLTNPEAKAKCTNERHIKVILHHLGEEQHQDAALQVLLVLLKGLDGPWIEFVVKRLVIILAK